VAEALVPVRNAAEATAVQGLVVRAVETFSDAVGHLRGTLRLPAVAPMPWPAPAETVGEGRDDMISQVRGQPFAVRAAVIAAAGGAQPSARRRARRGKTLLARAIRSLLPPLSHDEALEVSRVHSAAGLLDGGLVTCRPYRRRRTTRRASPDFSGRAQSRGPAR